MKTGFVVVLVVMQGAVMAAAQGTGQQKGPTILFNDSARAGARQQGNAVVLIPAPAMSDGCPVSMRAQHLSDGSMVRTGSVHPKGIGQWLHLTFTSPESKQIASARLTVRGARRRAA